jgi:hypothetical protein
MKRIRLCRCLLFGLLLTATPTFAALAPTAPITTPAKLDFKDDVQQVFARSQRAELPLECRGYYVRSHKTPVSIRCD